MWGPESEVDKEKICDMFDHILVGIIWTWMFRLVTQFGVQQW